MQYTNTYMSHSKLWLQKNSLFIIGIHIIFITLREHLVSPPVFGGIRVARLFSFLCCIFCLVCLRPVTCVPNVASFSGLSIPASPFGFLDRLFYILIIMDMWVVLCYLTPCVGHFYWWGNRNTQRKPSNYKLDQIMSLSIGNVRFPVHKP